MRQAFECERSYELCRFARHHDVDRSAKLRELASKMRGFERRYAAGHTEEDVFVVEDGCHFSSQPLVVSRQQSVISSQMLERDR